MADAMHTEYIRRLLDIFPDVAFSLDANGQIVAANQRACANLGYGVAELEGRPLAEFAEMNSSAAADIVKLWRGTNGPLPASLRLRSRNGEVVSYQANGGNVAAAGEPANLIVRCVAKKKSIAKFSELTQTIAALSAELHNRRVLEIALRNAKDAAVIADRAKSQFLANMSHELRTPLNAIIGFSEMIAEEYLGPDAHDKYRDYARDVHSSGQHLLSLINDVLDMAKIESGNFELYPEPTDPMYTVGPCLRLLQPQAEIAGVTVVLGSVPKVPVIVQADQKRLKQVLLNLLSNAVKFTPRDGTIMIGVTCNGDHVDISVADTGIGMSPEEIEEALQPFRQIDNSISRKYEGTGLGLPIAKRLTEMNGGRFIIESTPGRGTTVRVSLPISVARGTPARIAPDQAVRALTG